MRNINNYLAFVSQIEPRNVKEAEEDPNWIITTEEELNQFKQSNTWQLVERPLKNQVTGTKWVFKNRLDEHGVIIRNKVRLVAQDYNQKEGIDYNETFVPVARLEIIRLLLAFACIKNFKLY